jgi:threonine/homoserine/homoserine lactone efflux protein
VDYSHLALFTAVLGMAAASPGPAIAAIVARVLARGIGGTTPFIVGLIFGDLAWLTLAVLGLSVVAQTFHAMFLAIKYAGAAYLLWLAYKLWTEPAVAISEGALPPPSRAAWSRAAWSRALAGLALSLGNPKTMLFYLALLPTIVDLAAVTALAFAELFAVTLVVVTGVFVAYALAAARARQLFRSPRALTWLNRASGTMMAGAAAAVATR